MADTPLPVSPITGNPSVLRTSNGPPLILVFLASGLLVGAVLSILVLRHIYPSRFVRSTPVRVQKPVRPLGERPKLWDVYSLNGGGKYWHVKWEVLLPLAATFLPELEDSAPEPLPPCPPSTSHRPHPWPWVDWLLRLSRRHRHQSVHNDLEDITVVTEDQPQLGRLQIAVIIAMPSRQSSARGSWACPEKQGEASLPDLEEERDLCIGLVEVQDVPRCFEQDAEPES